MTLKQYDALIEEMGGLVTVGKLLPVPITRVGVALAKGDTYLNTISLRVWDKAAGRRNNSLTADIQRDYSMKRDGWPARLSLAERVFILKRAAIRLATEPDPT